MSYEDLCSGKHCSICKAYATFVAQGPLGSKVSSGWWLGGTHRGRKEMASAGLGWAQLSITAVSSWVSDPCVGCTVGGSWHGGHGGHLLAAAAAHPPWGLHRVPPLCR